MNQLASRYPKHGHHTPGKVGARPSRIWSVDLCDGLAMQD